MARLYYDEHGNPSPLPVGQEDGKKHRTKMYIDRVNVCQDCGDHLFYTKNNKCVKCARADACDLYGYLHGIMTVELTFEGTITSYQKRGLMGPVGNRIVPDNYKDTMEELSSILDVQAPTSIRQAQKIGASLWLRAEPCSVAGHYGIRTLKNECYFCEQEKKKPKPRQVALRSGKTWYIPAEPCVHCGTLSERNVHNGSCRGCLGSSGDSRRSDDSLMMEQNPNMILTKADAIKYGIKVYRHGRPCNKGHKGFRYVSTNSCIDCLRGVPEVTI